MIPYFNTSGPCVVGRHYLLPPERRLGRVMELIEQGRYLTLHAGRQTGKTTSARWLVEHYNQGQAYHSVWVDVQTAREQPDESKAMREILMELERSFRRDLSALTLPTSAEIQGFLTSPASAMLEYLTRVCQQSPRPLIILFDEVDGLVGPAMVSFLTQLRRGYMDRDKVPIRVRGSCISEALTSSLARRGSGPPPHLWIPLPSCTMQHWLQELPCHLKHFCK